MLVSTRSGAQRGGNRERAITLSITMRLIMMSCTQRKLLANYCGPVHAGASFVEGNRCNFMYIYLYVCMSVRHKTFISQKPKIVVTDFCN